VANFESVLGDNAFVVLIEWEDRDAWRAPNYLLVSEEWNALQAISQVECLKIAEIYDGRNVDVADLPQPNDVVEILAKRLTTDEATFDAGVEVFREEILDKEAYLQGDFKTFNLDDFRVNVNAYPDLRAVLRVGLDVVTNPQVSGDHFNDFDMQCMYFTHRFDWLNLRTRTWLYYFSMKSKLH